MIARVEIAVVSEPAKMFDAAMLLTAFMLNSFGFSLCVTKSFDRISLFLEPLSFLLDTSLTANWRRVPCRAEIAR